MASTVNTNVNKPYCNSPFAFLNDNYPLDLFYPKVTRGTRCSELNFLAPWQRDVTLWNSICTELYISVVAVIIQLYSIVSYLFPRWRTWSFVCAWLRNDTLSTFEGFRPLIFVVCILCFTLLDIKYQLNSTASRIIQNITHNDFNRLLQIPKETKLRVSAIHLSYFIDVWSTIRIINHVTGHSY